jgi:hypothetical protein
MIRKIRAVGRAKKPGGRELAFGIIDLKCPEKIAAYFLSGPDGRKGWALPLLSGEWQSIFGTMLCLTGIPLFYFLVFYINQG